MLEDGNDLSAHEKIVEDLVSQVQFIGEIPFTDNDLSRLRKSLTDTITCEADFIEACEKYPVSIACFLILKAIDSPDIDSFWYAVFKEIQVEKTQKNQELCTQTFMGVLNQTDNLFSEYHHEGEDFFFLLGLHCLIQKDPCHDLENLVSNIKKGMDSQGDNMVQGLIAPDKTRIRREEVAHLDELLLNSHDNENFEVFLKKLAVIALFNKEKTISQTAYTLLHKIYSSIEDNEILVSPEIEHGLSLIFEREPVYSPGSLIYGQEKSTYEQILQEQHKIPALITEMLVDQKVNVFNQYRELIQEIKSELFSEIQENLKETLYSINEARIKTQYQIETDKKRIVTDISQCIDSAKTLEKTINEIQSAIEKNTSDIRGCVQEMGSEIHSDILLRQDDAAKITDSLNNLIYTLNPSINTILTEIRHNNSDTLDLLQIVEDKTRTAIEASEQTIISDIESHLQTLHASVQASKSDIVAEVAEKNAATTTLLQDISDRDLRKIDEIALTFQAGMEEQEKSHRSLNSILEEVGKDVLRTKTDMLTVLKEIGDITHSKVDESEMHIISEIQDHIKTLHDSFSTSNSELLSEFRESKGDTQDLLRKIENRTLSRITESEIASTQKIESRVMELSDSLDTAKSYLGSKILQNKEDMLKILREINEISQQKIEKGQTDITSEIQTRVLSLEESLQDMQSAVRSDLAENIHDVVTRIQENDSDRNIILEDLETKIIQEIHLQNSLLNEFKDISQGVVEDVSEKLVDSSLIIEEMKNYQSKFTSDFSHKIDGIVSQLQAIAHAKVTDQQNEITEHNEITELKQKAAILLREDAVKEAITLYYEIIHKCPEDTDSRIFLAYMVIKTGLYDEGIRIIKTELKEGFQSEMLDFWYAYAQYRTKKIDQMPFETESIFREAKKAYHAKKYDEARSQLESVEANHSNDPRYAIYRAFCLLKAGDLVGALAWVTRCRKLDPIDQKVTELESILVAKTAR